MVEHLNDGDLGADGVIIRRHFKTYNAAADDDELLRDLLQIEDLTVGHNESRLVKLAQSGDGRHNGHRTGAEKQVDSAVGLAVGFNFEALGVFA